jgi:UDP-N-acetylmuramate--alanine ligase
VLRRIQHVHFVGIGGSGMSGIAEVLLNLGYTVSGSDLRLTPVTDRLASLGATVFEGHKAENARGAHVVVTSTAVRPRNPEVDEARRYGVPVIPRAEMLAELMRLKYGVAVAGSHGKTTTTSMVALVLDRGGLDPTVVVGGRLGVLGSGARLGKGEFLVAEADESDRSFLRLTPTIAVVTNIDREHLDTYRDLADVQEAFLGFVNKVPFYGGAVLCLDDPPVQDILPRVERRVVTYGLTHQASVSARDLELSATGSHYTATLDGRALGSLTLSVPGAFNVANSLAAVAVGLDLEVPFHAIRAGLESFTGVDRRFQVRGETTTATTPPRSARPSTRCAAARASGGRSSSSSRTATRARGRSGTSSPAPSSRPTSSCSPTSIPPPRSRSRASPPTPSPGRSPGTATGASPGSGT